MLEGGIIAKLLDEKWKTFAMMMFYKKMFFLILHLLCISFSIYSRPEFSQPLMRGLQPGTEMEDEDIIRWVQCIKLGPRRKGHKGRAVRLA